MYTLQRKLKTSKQALESKELHVDMMRKKMASLEERVTQLNHLVMDKEEAMLKVSAQDYACCKGKSRQRE